MNDPATPAANVAAAALLMVGGSFTVTVNCWLSDGSKPFWATRPNVYRPPAPTGGVPDRVPVPSPSSVKVSQAGSASAGSTPRVASGNPSVVTMNVPAVPTVNVVAFGLLIVGCSPTVSVAAVVVAEPAVLVNTARKASPESAPVAVIV